MAEEVKETKKVEKPVVKESPQDVKIKIKQTIKFLFGNKIVEFKKVGEVAVVPRAMRDILIARGVAEDTV